jgi:putative two-component system response regulator
MVAPIQTKTNQVNILLVDDEPLNNRVVRKHLEREGYADIREVNSGEAAIKSIADRVPDLVMLDVFMPGMTGLEVLQRLRDDEKSQRTPCLMLTSSSDAKVRHDALSLGATDFLSKPVDPAELRARLKNTLAAKQYEANLKNKAEQLEHEVRLRTEEIAETRLEVVHCLARAAEYRDNDTGKHILRVGRYSGIIARGLGLSEYEVNQIELAAPLHDVGKIGIPDEILLKPGKLDLEEMEIIRRHTTMGARVFDEVAQTGSTAVRRHTELGSEILGNPRFSLLQLAKTIALTHHEKFDGSGYPLGLAGEDIPLPGRIVAVADVYDALSTKRPYKDPFPRQKCFDILESDRGSHFDPAVLNAFFAAKDQIIETQIAMADL